MPGPTLTYASSDPFEDAPSFRDCRCLYPVTGLILAGGIDPTQTKTLAQSSDGGATWSYLTTDPFGAGRCFAVLNNGSRIIAGGDRPTNPLKYSDNGGSTWTAPAHQFQNTGVANTGVHVLAYGSGSTVWAGGWGTTNGGSVQTDGLAVSTDGGTTWATHSSPFAYSGVFNTYCLDICVSGSDILAVGNDGTSAENSIFLSTNSGSTWTHLTEAFNNTDTESCLISGSRLLVGGFPSVNYPAIKYSDDSGVTWNDPTVNGVTTVFGCTRIAKIGGALWAGLNTDVASGQIFLSVDNGATWDLLTSQPFADSVHFQTDTWAIVQQGSDVIVGGTSEDLAHTIATGTLAQLVWSIGRLGIT